MNLIKYMIWIHIVEIKKWNWRLYQRRLKKQKIFHFAITCQTLFVSSNFHFLIAYYEAVEFYSFPTAFAQRVETFRKKRVFGERKCK